MIGKLLKRWRSQSDHEEQSDSISNDDNRSEVSRVDQLIEQGQAFQDGGYLEKAEKCYRKAVKESKGCARAYLNLGNVLGARGEVEDAVNNYHLALRCDPNSGGAYINLGTLYVGQNRYRAAYEYYTQAARLLVGMARVDALIGVGVALNGLNRTSEAISVYREVLDISPEHPGANLNLGHLLMLQGRCEDAAKCLRVALGAMPNHAQGHSWLGKVLADQGLIEESLTHMDKACRLDADDAYMVGMRVFTLNYDCNCTADQLFSEQKKFARGFLTFEHRGGFVYKNPREPERRLKVGYVSSDFKDHPVSRFVQPLFEHHDRSRFEVHAVYSSSVYDSVSEKLKQLADGWHCIDSVSDGDAYQLLRDAEIDILVDLSGLTEGHRLELFARKPAPLQATWLGYLGTTAMDAMDYRICDTYTDPPGMTERFHTEKLARLPRCQWCHGPYAMLPAISEAPMLGNGYPTFGSFNNAAKLNDKVLALWGQVLREVDGSRLRIVAVPGRTAEERILVRMGEQGVAPDRIEFIPRMPYTRYLEAITGVDIALDPFPYNGGTTSIDILMMGVPVVTLAGDRSIGRGGLSLLSNLGLEELIANTEKGYISIVKGLTSNPSRLAVLRKELRGRVEQSPLLDGPGFTADLEALYRQWWRDWCRTS